MNAEKSFCLSHMNSCCTPTGDVHMTNYHIWRPGWDQMAEKILSSSSSPPATQLHSPPASVSAVHIFPLATEVEQLRTAIALLKDTLASLQLPSSQRHPLSLSSRSQTGSRSRHWHHWPASSHPSSPSVPRAFSCGQARVWPHDRAGHHPPLTR